MTSRTDTMKKIKAVVIGSSAGGMDALTEILSRLPAEFPVPILAVQHLSPVSENYLVKHLDSICSLRIKEADEKEQIRKGTAYFAPPNYHLLVEEDSSLSLSVEPRVNYSRPSIDVLFESAAIAFGSHLIGVILTGANNDGSKGLMKIKEAGGIAIVQSPATAYVDSMPIAAIEKSDPQFIMSLSEIAQKLIELCSA